MSQGVASFVGLREQPGAEVIQGIKAKKELLALTTAVAGLFAVETRITDFGHAAAVDFMTPDGALLVLRDFCVLCALK